jgi:hypothetical protein
MTAIPTNTTIIEQLPRTPPIPTVGSEITRPEDKPDVKSPAHLRMEKKWRLLHDLLGGTEAMRAARTRWLPQEPKEEDDAYSCRIDRAVLYNATEATLDGLVAKPFSQAVTMDESLLPAQMGSMHENIDKCGTDATSFTKDVFRKGLEYGLTHVLVDFPVMSDDATLADEIESEARPVLVRIDPPDLLGWRSERTDTGSLRLTQIRFHEVRVEDVGLYGDEEVDYIRVYNAPGADGELGTWELWRKGPNEVQYAPHSNGTHTFPGVPLFTFYVNKTGFMEGTPPLEDLMWLNVAHWQTSADLRNTLRMVLAAIFCATGIEEEKLKEMVFGPNSFLKAEQSDAKFFFAEHSGKGISAGRDELKELEARMEILGLKPLIERSSRSTATGKIIDESRTSSDIQQWIRVLESFMVELFKASALWINEELSEDFTFDIFNDFGIGARASDDLAELREMRKMIPPAIDHETYLREVKRRSLLADDVDIEEVMRKVADEMVLPATDGSEDVIDDDDDEEVDEGDESSELETNVDEEAA